MKKIKLFSLLLLFILIAITGCSQETINTDVDLSTWDEDKVYAFFNEVDKHLMTMPTETTSKEEIIQEYEKYFSTELSEEMFNSLYIKTDNGWKVVEGIEAMFIAPNAEYEGSEVKMEFNEDFIKIKVTYEIGLYSKIEYTIRYQDRPIITEFKAE